jgi:hypothetical protein
LDDRAARRPHLDHLAGLDAGRERDADLHFFFVGSFRARGAAAVGAAGSKW